MTAQRISGIILAAGTSRRFGTPKQLLDIDGRPMLRRVIESALESALSEVIVVLGCRADEIRDRVRPQPDGRLRFVDCAGWASGASASLKCGVAAVAGDCTAAAILLGDQPGLPVALIDRVLSAFIEADRPLARPVFGDDRLPGHPVVIDRRLFDDLFALQGDAGARTLLNERPNEVLEVEVDGPAPADIDTPDDYAALRS